MSAALRALRADPRLDADEVAAIDVALEAIGRAEATLARVRSALDDYAYSLDDHIGADDFARALDTLRAIAAGREAVEGS